MRHGTEVHTRKVCWCLSLLPHSHPPPYHPHLCPRNLTPYGFSSAWDRPGAMEHHPHPPPQAWSRGHEGMGGKQGQAEVCFEICFLLATLELPSAGFD